MNKKRKKIFLSILATFFFICIAGAGTVYYYLFYPQFHPSKTTYIYIDRDDTTDSIFNKIKKQGNPHSFNGFKWMSHFREYSKNIHTGRYAIKPGDNTYQLYSRLSRGYQTPVNLTIGSVRTLDRLVRSVGKQLMIDSAEIAMALYDSIFLEKMGYTLASIVEEETNNNAEKPMVAGLYINRLHAGMPLQADPTIKFALQDFGLRRITNQHLDVQSPYNTYLNAGLPPGPIRIPSPKGLDSVLNYVKHNYIYMCAKEDFSGTHNFASNYADHMVNARKYWKALNERKIFK